MKKKHRICMMVIMFILIIFYSSPVFAQGLDKLDSAGVKILNISRRIGYWIIVIQATKSIIESALKGAMQDIGGTILKYVMIYAALFIIPWALRLVEGIF